MLKICDESICKPLGIIFRSCLENEKFPSEWKKANLVLVFKKNSEELKNYRSIFYCLLQAKYLKGFCMTACSSFSPRIV